MKVFAFVISLFLLLTMASSAFVKDKAEEYWSFIQEKSKPLKQLSGKQKLGYVYYSAMWLPGMTYCTWFVPKKFQSIDFNTAHSLCMEAYKS